MLGFFVSVCVIGRCGRLPVGGWLGYRGGCRKAKRDSNGLSRPFYETKNNLLPQSPDTPRIKKLIPFRYLGHSMKPKTTLYLNLRTFRESKNRFRFVTSPIPRSRKQLSVSISGHSANQKNRFCFVTSDIPRSRKQLSISISGHSVNQKTDSVSLPRTFHEAKNNSLSRSLDTPRIKKQISFRYLGHPTESKTTFCLNLRTFRGSKN